MKRVAFLSFDWDYKVVSEYYLGVQDYLAGRDGLQVVIFNAFGKYHLSHQPKDSTLKVFSLFDPADFDGILVQGNRTWPPALRQQVVDKAVALGKPVVSINYDLAGAHSVGTDNYQEEYDLVYRVLSERGCTRPAFVNGLKTSVEAQRRAQGFRDACARRGIQDVRFYQANWQIEAGVLTAKKLLKKRDDLPDVIFCCNDDLAVGMLETLQEAGVRVPEDVMVTGFDNRSISRRTVPRITTIDRDYRAISATAMDLLIRLMAGEEAPEHTFSPARHIMAESCRYSAHSDAEALNAYRANDYELGRFRDLLAEFQTVMLNAESLYAVLEECEVFAQELGCPNAYLALDDAYLRASMPDIDNAASELCHLAARKGRSTLMRCDGRHVYASYRSRDILPPDVPSDRPLYLVTPLYHNASHLGMIVTEGVPASLRVGLNAFFLTVLASAIVFARTTELLREARGEG